MPVRDVSFACRLIDFGDDVTVGVSLGFIFCAYPNRMTLCLMLSLLLLDCSDLRERFDSSSSLNRKKDRLAASHKSQEALAAQKAPVPEPASVITRGRNLVRLK